MRRDAISTVEGVHLFGGMPSVLWRVFIYVEGCRPLLWRVFIYVEGCHQYCGGITFTDVS